MVHVIAGDAPAAAVDAALLGLREGEWSFVEDHTQLTAQRSLTVCVGSAASKHPDWPAIDRVLANARALGRVHYVPDLCGD